MHDAGGRARGAGHDAAAPAATAGDLASLARAGLGAVVAGAARVGAAAAATRTGNLSGQLALLVHRPLPVAVGRLELAHLVGARAAAGRAADGTRPAAPRARHPAATTTGAAGHPAGAAAAAAGHLLAPTAVGTDLLHAQHRAIAHAALRRQRAAVGLGLLGHPRVDQVAGFLAHLRQAPIEVGTHLRHRAQRPHRRRQWPLGRSGRHGKRRRVLDGEREGQGWERDEPQRQLAGLQIARERVDAGQDLARQRIRGADRDGGHQAASSGSVEQAVKQAIEYRRWRPGGALTFSFACEKFAPNRRPAAAPEPG